MATISIDGGGLVVEMHGMDRFWALKSRLIVPLSHVRGAKVDAEIARKPAGWRAPGSYLPGVIAAGTYRRDGQRDFWMVHDNHRAIVIELEDDRYRWLVIEVDDPAATIALIEHALAGR